MAVDGGLDLELFFERILPKLLELDDNLLHFMLQENAMNGLMQYEYLPRYGVKPLCELQVQFKIKTNTREILVYFRILDSCSFKTVTGDKIIKLKKK